jgi:hypothetical protein
MVSFQTINPNLGKFWMTLDWKMLIYFMAIWNILQTFGIFYRHWGYFMTIWYIWCSLGLFFPVWVIFATKNLATLLRMARKGPVSKIINDFEKEMDETFSFLTWLSRLHL